MIKLKTNLTKAIVGVLTFTLILAASSTPASALATASISWMFLSSSAKYPEVDGYPWRITYGSGRHGGADYYAQDWNWKSGNSDCNKIIRAPISGTILFSGDSGGSYGKTIVIRSSEDSNYAWRGAHLNYIPKSMIAGKFITAGTKLARIGNTGLTAPDNLCHLHSTFYKNINDSAAQFLREGGAFTTSGGPSQYAYSPCERFSSEYIYVFTSSECMYYRGRVTKVGGFNLNENFNDRILAIHVPAGKSVRIYRDRNGAGSTRCITGSMWNLARDQYSDGSEIVVSDKSTISSFRSYDTPNCAT